MTGRLSLVDIDDIMRTQVDPLVELRAGPSTARGSRGLIIMLFTNAGFMPFLKNLICGMERVAVTNYLVVAFDNSTCPALRPDFRLRRAVTSDPSCVFPYAHRPLTTGGIARYRSLEFNRMVMQRPLWILHLLRRGFETLQVDLDITWIADPQPLFASKRYAQHDMLFQSEGGYGFNAGFYLARPGAGSMSLLESWIADLSDKTESRSFEEQHSLGRALSHRNRSVPMLYAKLNMSEFPNGKIWWQYQTPESKRSVYVVHCNWNKSNKKGRLVRDNLWALDDADARCSSSWDPHASECSRFCRPVRYCSPGALCPRLTCKQLNSTSREKWHPMARAEMGCSITSE